MLNRNRVVFCFAGQGYTPSEVAHYLYKCSESFRSAIDTVDDEVTKYFQEQQARPFAPLGQYLVEDEHGRRLRQVCTEDKSDSSPEHIRLGDESSKASNHSPTDSQSSDSSGKQVRGPPP